jgi:hypothetical protein
VARPSIKNSGRLTWIDLLMIRNDITIAIGTLIFAVEYPSNNKILADYYSRSNDLNSRSVQNIFRGLTKSGLLVKCKKSYLICKANKTYEVTYRISTKNEYEFY